MIINLLSKPSTMKLSGYSLNNIDLFLENSNNYERSDFILSENDFFYLLYFCIYAYQKNISFCIFLYLYFKRLRYFQAILK